LALMFVMAVTVSNPPFRLTSRRCAGVCRLRCGSVQRAAIEHATVSSTCRWPRAREQEDTLPGRLAAEPMFIGARRLMVTTEDGDRRAVRAWNWLAAFLVPAGQG